MRNRFLPIAAAALFALGFAQPAHADDKVKAVASFSILGDMVRNVGGDRVEVLELVGPDGDGHTYSPTPADAKTLAGAQIFFVNGLGFEGWMERLEKSSGFKGQKIVASTGVTPREMEEDDDYGDHAKDDHDDHDHDKHAKDDHDDHDHDKHAKDDHDEHDHDDDKHAEGHHHHGGLDPHAWQSLDNGVIYVKNIRDGLIAADPEGKDTYEANAKAYIEALEAENAAVKKALDAIPEQHRRIITSHDAFGYFGAAYDLEVLAPEDVSTESEPSAKDVAEIIRQIRKEKIPAIFMENITNPAFLEQISRDTGAKIGGTLHSDALSGPDGSAPTYIDMFKHNVETLTSALASSS
ncbi:MAG: metal ABC transporter substrate-binding protein [Methyloceanibacter sp.]|nr:metal ABC transporter substrate-binding protein [Methyloceanibacter sp.]